MTNAARSYFPQNNQPNLSLVPQLSIDFGGLIDLDAFSSTRFVLDADGQLKPIIEPKPVVENNEIYSMLPQFEGALLNAFNDSYIREIYYMDFRSNDFREEKNVPAALNSFEAKLLGWKLKAMQSDSLFEDSTCLNVGDVISVFDRNKQETDRVAMVAGFNDDNQAIIVYTENGSHTFGKLDQLYSQGERLTVHQYQYNR